MRLLEREMAYVSEELARKAYSAEERDNQGLVRGYVTADF